jgi:hypothetical protein
MPATSATAERSRSQIGRANLAKSKISEQRVVGYLRARGWPGAERTVRTGYHAPGRQSRDRGDIDGTPGLVWQVKNCAVLHVETWLAETEDQRLAAGADYGVLVVKRPGHAHPARWNAYLPLRAWLALLGSGLAVPGGQAAAVALELQHLLLVLHAAGYGTPNGTERAA